ncbi:iron export ABC transporter permease subunit FetB [Vallitalea pronyensis]|uniref:Iron export ABC transporter permease subunit FetB n=1 Tax=Vallitalea pronyensis TaxID=1348613 RepID=A0A8J8MJ85_9FIRM|nr:iron export ABC transporter permease subunit FetB [Vallitalea pronyensis]QUI22506.1 iron export ABC transporter permease subunit FetB [Vallitalea pronyensis]
MKGIIDLSVIQVALAYIFVVFVLIVVKRRGIHREKEIIVSSIRMTLQLILTGYVLQFVFDNPNAFITIGIIILMELFAIYTIFKKFKGKLSHPLKKVIAVAMSIGTFSCIVYFLLVVIRINPWFDPRYFIPIAGMLIGNSMTGISLGIHSLIEGMTVKRAIIEEALILGATPQKASRTVINNAFDAAILPTINSMVGMGIIFLPGMMTGQILGGADPTTAIAYQIAIMLGILGSVALTVVIMLKLSHSTFFNDESQLI